MLKLSIQKSNQFKLINSKIIPPYLQHSLDIPALDPIQIEIAKQTLTDGHDIKSIDVLGFGKTSRENKKDMDDAGLPIEKLPRLTSTNLILTNRISN